MYLLSYQPLPCNLPTYLSLTYCLIHFNTQLLIHPTSHLPTYLPMCPPTYISHTYFTYLPSSYSPSYLLTSHLPTFQSAVLLPPYWPISYLPSYLLLTLTYQLTYQVKLSYLPICMSLTFHLHANLPNYFFSTWKSLRVYNNISYCACLKYPQSKGYPLAF